MNHKDMKCTMDVLSQAGLQPELVSHAMTGSVYIKFGAKIRGKLRIADHRQRSRYAYRWNLRKEVTSIEVRQKGHDCYYYPYGDFETMLKDMIHESNLSKIGANMAQSLIRNLECQN